MIITSTTKIDDNVLSILTTNPQKHVLEEEKNRESLLARRVADYSSSIESRKRDIQSLTLRKLVDSQALSNSRKTVESLQKLLESSDKPELSITTDELVSFFNSIGMTFVSLSIKQDGSRAALYFIRESKMISCLPIPPLLVAIAYKNYGDGQGLNFYEVSVETDIEVDGYFHPHISDTSVCLGNLTDILERDSVPLTVSNYQDHVILVDNLLSTYNPNSPYEPIDQIVTSEVGGININRYKEIVVNNYSYYTFKNPTIDLTDTINLAKLITKERYQTFFDRLREISLVDVLDDAVAYLTIQTSNDYESDYTWACEYKNKLNQLSSSFQLSDVDSEDEGLCEDDFYDLLSRWKKEIVCFLSSKGSESIKVEFDNLPDLDNIYETQSQQMEFPYSVSPVITGTAYSGITQAPYNGLSTVEMQHVFN